MNALGVYNRDVSMAASLNRGLHTGNHRRCAPRGNLSISTIYFIHIPSPVIRSCPIYYPVQGIPVLLPTTRNKRGDRAQCRPVHARMSMTLEEVRSEEAEDRNALVRA